MVLTYFSSTPEVMAKSTEELASVMKHIDDKDLLPPIQVVQALSRSNVATIGLLKGYIGKKIEHERAELKQVSIWRDLFMSPGAHLHVVEWRIDWKLSRRNRETPKRDWRTADKVIWEQHIHDKKCRTDMSYSARIFQVQKCSGCEGNLDLPAIHFLCRHSYHQR